MECLYTLLVRCQDEHLCHIEHVLDLIDVSKGVYNYKKPSVVSLVVPNLALFVEFLGVYVIILDVFL